MKSLAHTYRLPPLKQVAGALAALLIAAQPGHAEKADKEFPMNAMADAVRHDEQKQTTELTGNVLITKGSVVMRGAKVEVRTDAAGNQSATIYAAPGSTAFFKQKREGMNEFIEGEAEQIDYAGATATVTLQRRAVMRRLAGTTVLDELKGGRIVYDNTSERYAVEGGPGHATPQNPSGRVSAVIAAKPKASAAPPSVTPPAPASSAGISAPGLRLAPKIGDGPK